MRNLLIAALLTAAVPAATSGAPATAPAKRPTADPIAGAAHVKTVDNGAYPAFETDGYALRVEEMENRSKVDLAERGTRDHSTKLDCKLEAPKEQDAVAVTREFAVSSIVDEEKNSLIAPKAAPKTTAGGAAALPAVAMPKAAQEYIMNTYVAFLDGVAKVEVPTTKLKKSANLIQAMELKATVILAEERQDKTIPAAIMETPDSVVPGATMRITAMQLTPARELMITVKCERERGGLSGPFIEQVWVLDENNEVIDGGRWTKGDPLSKTGTLTIKVILPKNKNHKSVKFVACTKYSRKPMTFTVKDIFQR